MSQFEEILKSYSPMITAVLKKAKVYKNHQYYRHVATVALWNAWRKYDPSRGDFAPYAYRCMLTTIFSEMHNENLQNNRFICYEKEKLDVISQYYNQNKQFESDSELLEQVLKLLKKEDIILLYHLYVNEYTYKELTEMTGISISALKKRRNRIMKKIRDSFFHEK